MAFPTDLNKIIAAAQLLGTIEAILFPPYQAQTDGTFLDHAVDTTLDGVIYDLTVSREVDEVSLATLYRVCAQLEKVRVLFASLQETA